MSNYITVDGGTTNTRVALVIDNKVVDSEKIYSENPAKTDMMRGEETEIVELIDEFGTDCVYVLPGSHSKLIVPDSEKRIESFKTMMTGEMISALSKNTILNGTVDLSIKEHDTPSLIMGYEYCIKYGINDALFTTRILKNLFSKSDVEIYSYFLGVILANEIESLKRYNKKGVVIGGKSQLKKAMCDLLKATTDLEIISVPEKSVDDCVFMGQIKIFEYQKNPHKRIFLLQIFILFLIKLNNNSRILLRELNFNSIFKKFTSYIIF